MKCFKSFPHYSQLDSIDCGPTCLRIITKYYGRNYTLKHLRDKFYITRDGVSMQGISGAAQRVGFKTQGLRLSYDKLLNGLQLPAILHWNRNHFIVLYKIKKVKKNVFRSKEFDHVFYISDPAHKKHVLDSQSFKDRWMITKDEGLGLGTALILTPKTEFYQNFEYSNNQDLNNNLNYYLKYLLPYKSQIAQLIIAMLIGSIFALILPFMTQAIVDQGINHSNLRFITLVLIIQLVVSVTQTTVTFIQTWITLHINTRISITLISDFLSKLLKLPIAFFDSKSIGDILQRIDDHDRIQSFMTGSTLLTLFSFFNFFIFCFILGYYNLTILGIFLTGNSLYVTWVLIFMNYKRKLEYSRFTQASSGQSNLVEIISGIQEIKLNNYEKQQRWNWERVQVKLFKVSVKGLALEQIQQIGTVFLSHVTTLIITFISAKAVIEGHMTFGIMMAISYILGQLSGPIGQVLGFANSFQSAKISLERLNEIHNEENEEKAPGIALDSLTNEKAICIDNISFNYDVLSKDYILKDFSLTIPARKITAIVGASGSGKTTILKLLLGLYSPIKGDIKISGISLNNIDIHSLRENTGAVMQDSFIFSDTIANNIALGKTVNEKKLFFAAKTANVKDFIESLPLKYDTRIGSEGIGISQGQKQRLLIARAIYKDPTFLFFDEATNALDANNEKVIIENLNEFYKGKTVVIVAHRLSTVQNADLIVVLDKGRVIEQGTHKELIAQMGSYYTLIKNQLELGL